MCDCGTGKQPPGAALVIAMLVMAVLLLAGTAFLTISSTESQIARNERASVEAFVLAEAAINKATARLNADSSYAGETGTALGGGTFTVTVTTTAGCTPTSARGLLAASSVPVPGGQARAQLQVTLDHVSYPFRWAGFAAVPNGVVGEDRREKELWIGLDSGVDSFDSSLGSYDATTNRGAGGSIGANGDVTLERNTQILGNVTAGDAIHTGSGVSVSGSQTRRATAEVFPPVTPGTTPTGGLTVPSNTGRTLTAGTYAYTTMIFGNGASLATSGGPVTIYVTGSLSLGNDVTLGANPGTQLRIIAKSDGLSSESVTFVAGSNLRLYGSLYGRNTDVSLGNGAQIHGSIIARTIATGNQAAMHFDQAMSDQEICHGGRFNTRRGTWREVIS